ncbi:zincin-like metallopeptidase domain-containing protein [Tardiphaga sp. 285_C5_N1_2]|uniref:ArdC family protein n=1 Tax=Tardiphaga sp. 285_C5_N1_2 TaxID=3240775 RepID=UPI003F8BA9E8
MPARSATATPRRDIHTEITATLIAQIETSPGEPALPWRQPNLSTDLPTNALTERPYSGINIISLWAAAIDKGFNTSIWANYRQWAELGCQVRSGERSSSVIFFKEFETAPDPSDQADTGKRRVARTSNVFNAEQVDGFALPELPVLMGPIERLERVDAFIAATGARVVHGGSRAFYRPSTDHIQMPDEALFFESETHSRTEGYYAVLTHECIHWSGATHRLNREFGKRFGDSAYAVEELVAEIGAAFLSAELGITQDTRADHAQYLAHRLKLLKSDNRAIFTAAAKASEAVTFLKSFSSPP